MPVRSQNQGLVEAVQLGLRLLEGHVHVATDDLAPGRQRLVGVAPPGRRHDPDSGLGVDVVAERDRQDVQLRLQVVQPDPNGLRRLVERRSDVDVLAEAVPADRLHDEAGQLVLGRDVVDQHDLARVPDALDVLPDEQPVQLSVVVVPVTPNAFEDGRPVHERVRHDADPGVAQRHEPTLEVGDQGLDVGRCGCRMDGRCGLFGGRLVGQHRCRSPERAPLSRAFTVALLARAAGSRKAGRV